jgi:hypothetical protein
MDFQNFIERQEHRFHEVRSPNSLGEFLERLSISLVGPFLGVLEFLPAA